MPNNTYVWLRRIKVVEREHSSMRLTTERLLQEARHDPTILRGDVEVRDIIDATDHLEGTYFIRLFAEFETGLRLFWKTIRDTEPSTQRRDERYRRQAGDSGRSSRERPRHSSISQLPCARARSGSGPDLDRRGPGIPVPILRIPASDMVNRSRSGRGQGRPRDHRRWGAPLRGSAIAAIQRPIRATPSSCTSRLPSSGIMTPGWVEAIR